ncbi:MAG: gliding motility-associated C-terminal domain-containing protein, partial [Bacteroidetes bacterium]|nr:gliding motility-associated C-terminal domain-containing protein [Bacteroidota bacterium]
NLSNNNLFFADTSLASTFLYHNGSTGFTNFSAYKNHVFPRDSNSFAEDVAFLSINPASPDFLRPNPLIPSFVESMAQNIAGFTDDYFTTNIRAAYPLPGQLNNGGLAPDIGAIEGDYTPYADLGAIDFTNPKADSCYSSATNVTLIIKNHSIFNLDLSKVNVVVEGYAIDPSNNIINFAPITVSSGIIPPGAIMPVTISTNFNLSAPGLYQFIGWTFHPNDVDSGNDTIPFIYIYENVPGTAYTADTLICPSNNVELHLNGTLLPQIWQSSTDGGISWSNIPGGNISPYVINPATNVLIRADVCGNFSNVLSVEMDTSLVAAMSVTDVLCFNDTNGTVKINATGGSGNYTYSWLHNSSLTNDSISNLSAGIYHASISDDRGCFVEIQDTVKSPALLELTASIIQQVSCFGESDGEIDLLPFGGTAPYVFTGTTGQVSPPIAGLTGGTYVFGLEDANGCLASSAPIQLEGKALPVVNISGSTGICQGDSSLMDAGSGFSAYQWNTGAATQEVYLMLPGQYHVLVTDVNGCKNSDTISVTALNLPIVSITGKLSFCPGESTLIDAGPGFASYSWSTGESSPTISINNAGVYVVMVSGSNGCFNKDSVEVKEEVPAKPKITPANSLCDNGSPVSLKADLPNGNWTGKGLINNATGLFDPKMAGAGTHQVKYVLINNCKGSDSIFIMVNPAPTLLAMKDTTIYSGASFGLYAAGTGSYNWSPPSGLSCTSCENPVANPIETTTYYVELTDANACSNKDSVRVVLEIPLVKVFVPNTFSPNGDGYNDQLMVFGNIESMNFLVFNRWGQKIYESSNQSLGWDGNFNGEPQRPGVFVYILEAIHHDGRKEQLQGNVTLVR